MQVRGEFIRGDGLVIPNNVTFQGKVDLLQRAFRGGAQQYFMRLAKAVYAPRMTAADLNEPVGLGYARVNLPTPSGWPGIAAVNDEPYVESSPVVFTPTGAWTAVSRVCLCSALTGGFVYALSGPLATDLLATPSTPVADRTFRYRLYLG